MTYVVSVTFLLAWASLNHPERPRKPFFFKRMEPHIPQHYTGKGRTFGGGLGEGTSSCREMCGLCCVFSFCFLALAVLEHAL